MATFYICDMADGTRETPCVFSEWTMRPLWKRTGGDIARCIRHGSLITIEMQGTDKKEIQAKLRRERGR